MKTKTLIYIAGPMRGIPYYNFPAFDRAAEKFRGMGWEVINPADLDRDAGVIPHPEGKPVEDGQLAAFIERDRKAIRQCGAMALLPGWEKSEGVMTFELPLAHWLKLHVFEEATGTPVIHAISRPVELKEEQPPQHVCGLMGFGRGSNEIDVCPACEAHDRKMKLARERAAKSGEHSAGGMTVKDSGERQQFATGAQRDTQAGKGRMDLLPFHALTELAKLYEAGAKKYGDSNWRLGMPLSRYIDSAIRHLFKYAAGQRDEPHEIQAIWNLCGMVETERLVKMGALSPALLDLKRWDDADNAALSLEVIKRELTEFRKGKAAAA